MDVDKSLAAFEGALRVCLVLGVMGESDDQELPLILLSSISGCVFKVVMTTTVAEENSGQAAKPANSSVTRQRRPDIGSVVDKEIEHITTEAMMHDGTIETAVFDSRTISKVMLTVYSYGSTLC